MAQLHAAPAAIDCERLDLTSPQSLRSVGPVLWVNSGGWVRNGPADELWLLDTLGARIVQIQPPAASPSAPSLRSRSEHELLESGIELPLMIRPRAGASGVTVSTPTRLVELPAGHLPAGRSVTSHEVPVRLAGSELLVKTLWNVMPSPSGFFAYADLCVEGQCDPRESAGWISTFIHRDLGTGGSTVRFDSAPEIGFDEDLRRFYVEAADYLTVVGSDAYLLDLTQPTPRVVRLSLSETSSSHAVSLPEFPRFRTKPDFQGLGSILGPQVSTELLRMIQRQTLPVGLFSWAGELYLLAKEGMDAKSHTTGWWLTRLDRGTGAGISEVRLPTTAANVILVPGERWALVEQSEVEGRGPKQFPLVQAQSVLFLSHADLARLLPAIRGMSTELRCNR